MASKNNPKGRQNDIVIQQLKDEVLIHDLNINKAYCLNPTSAMVWNLCDGNNSVSDISQKLSQKLRQLVSEDFVYLTLYELKKDGLLDNSQEMTNKFEGVSRREVIRKAGFARMIALPVISSLVAPNAIQAQSTCVQPPFCTSFDGPTPPFPIGTNGGILDGCICYSPDQCVSELCAGLTGFLGVCSGLAGLCNATFNNSGASASCCPCSNPNDCTSVVCTGGITDGICA